jgi:hypothetical protein
LAASPSTTGIGKGWPQQMREPLVSSVKITDDTIRVVAAPTFTNDYLKDDFWASYDVDIDLSDSNEALALVPFVANVAPIVWLAGLDVSVPALDEAFADALDEVREVLAGMYPNLSWTGSITVDHRETTAGVPQVAALFSGGVDAVYSSLSVPEPQLLATVQGSDIALDNDEGWREVRRQARSYAEGRGHRNAFIRSNFKQFLDVPKLERRWPEVGGWWNGVQHGMGFLGLVAPLVPAGRVVIAATHTESFTDRAWGSNPRLDSSVRWGATTVDHHGYETSRQDKTAAIVEAGEPYPYLRVCFSNHYGKGVNCERCEKCLRTYAALVACGADPRHYGFTMSIEQGTRLIMRRFSSYRVVFSVTKTWHWGQIQQVVTDDDKDAEKVGQARAEFFRWLDDFDFARYERRWKLLLRLRTQLIHTVKRVPATP